MKMKSKKLEQQTNADRNLERPGFRWQRNLPIPVVLFIILSIGTLAGIGFSFKSMTLQNELVKLEAEYSQQTELKALRMSNEWLKNRVAVLQEEKAVLLDDAVANLNQKSKIIESILSSVGVGIPFQTSKENSGGPFTVSALGTSDEVILRSDRYLDTLQDVPLGAPVPGVITSRYGKRADPINGESAYHQGVDIRGRKGSDVKATADGFVVTQNYDKGHGRYIVLDHGNGFMTKYAHLHKSLVQKGDTVHRGQVIGLVGNSGRSTGPHVHYEIHYDEKIVNPTRFVRIAKYFNRENEKR